MTHIQYCKVDEFPYYTSANPDLEFNWATPDLKMINALIKKLPKLFNEYCIYKLECDNKKLWISNYNRYYATECIEDKYYFIPYNYNNNNDLLRVSPIKLTNHMIDVLQYVSFHNTTFHPTIFLMLAFSNIYECKNFDYEDYQVREEEISLLPYKVNKLTNVQLRNLVYLQSTCDNNFHIRMLVKKIAKYYMFENSKGTIINEDWTLLHDNDVLKPILCSEDCQNILLYQKKTIEKLQEENEDLKEQNNSLKKELNRLDLNLAKIQQKLHKKRIPTLVVK